MTTYRLPRLTPTRLRCEYAPTPLGIDAPHPRLSWRLSAEGRDQIQTAHHILAATSPELLAVGTPDLWDSSRVASDAQIVPYNGLPLQSGNRVYWAVRVWDRQNFPSPFSEPTWFEMGLLAPDDWRAEWLGNPVSRLGHALYVRRDFAVDRPVARARVYVCGLGLHEFYLNGAKVGDHVLEPATTVYDKRVLYVTHDVTDHVVQGQNVVGAILGSGWYGAPKLLLQLRIDYADGSSSFVATPEGWQATTGPILENSLYDGEVYDARLELDNWCTPGGALRGCWTTAMATESPGGRLVAQTMPPIRVTQTLEPHGLSEPRPRIFVYDFGQNFAGWARLKVSGHAGDTVTLRYAETLYPDGTVNQENLRAAAARDIYTLKGEGVEVWEPRFTYHGFRYVQVEAFPGRPDLGSITGCVVRSDTAAVGNFACSSDRLNGIHHLVLWTEISNEPGLPTDCPQRDERMGWLNDMAARSEQIVHNFDVAQFLSKWVADIHDTQDSVTGAITDTAPFRWGHRPADPVSICYLLIPWLLYQHYGDTRTMADHYEGMKGWVDYLAAQSTDHILSYSYWGDWAPPIAEGMQGSTGSSAVSAETPGALMSTGMVVYASRLLAQAAVVLGKDAEAKVYGALSDRVAVAYNERFYDPATGGYGSNNQACNAFSLYLGVVPDDRKARVIGNLVHDVVNLHDGHLTTGNLCTKYLLEVLTSAGHADVAYRIATQETYPSWGYMLANGATTLWERWELATGSGMNSHNHPMLGSVGAWLYRAVAGIALEPDGPGFARFHVRPHIGGGLTHASASIETVRGDVSSAWDLRGDRLILRVTVPPGGNATVSVPKLDTPSVTISESDSPIWCGGGLVGAHAGIHNAWDDGDTITFDVGSGHYAFDRQPEPVR